MLRSPKENDAEERIREEKKNYAINAFFTFLTKVDFTVYLL